jgi:hypothetical protein
MLPQSSIQQVKIQTSLIYSYYSKFILPFFAVKPCQLLPIEKNKKAA